MNVEQLRARHPRFTYRSYTVSATTAAIRVQFIFTIEPDLVFTPEIRIPARRQTGCHRSDSPPESPQPAESQMTPAVLNNLAFHLGMAEIASYWKTTCAPEIVVEAGPLDDWQCRWWQSLLLDGMTEFYATNNIDFTHPNFVTIRSQVAPSPTSHGQHSHAVDMRQLDAERVLVPVGGGKDAVVTIETLRASGHHLGCFVVNPTQAAYEIIQVAGISDSDTWIVSRMLDPRLFDLNEQGYLNGHTPFSSVIAFASTACALLHGYGRVAVSYERSSNEGNTWRYGREINHQYSKSFDFEQKFRTYLATYLAPSLEFFSLLRPLYEVQIARIFAQYPAYHSVFRSCNRGIRTNSWCGHCPKCLFVYATLYPFLSPTALKAIFSADLFANTELIPLAVQLFHADEQKPFECVGTREETLLTFALCVQTAHERGEPLPPLLHYLEDQFLRDQSDLSTRATALLTSWNDQHTIPPDLIPWLKRQIEQ